ncbi:hypothetical protein ACQ4PT_059904 [Festuca glaucescens]
MWARRLLLRRPNHLITSRLRPAVQRHNGTQTTVLGKNLTASRGHASDAANAPESATSRSKPDLLGSDQYRRRTVATKRHLYLVLDDHEHEYGIYKLDLDADPDTDSADARPLPEPAVIRLEVPKPPDNPRLFYAQSQFTAVGSCIVTTGAGWSEYLGQFTQGHALTIVYDTKTAALSSAYDLPENMDDGPEVAVAVGNRLYVLTPDGGAGGLQCMTTDCGDDDEKPWRWRPFSGSSRCFWGTEFFHHSPLFSGLEARAHAVHPQGRAFFVSFVDNRSQDDVTFSYDTVSNDWTRVGGWKLPFRGSAGYDRELDAWVGLHADKDDEEEARRIDGHLCACRVPSGDRPPEWKVGREKMVLDDAGWRHVDTRPEYMGERVDVKLVHMAERGEYCLVERLRRREGPDEKECLRDGDECLLRLTTFRVKYGDDGELIVAHRRARSYRVPRYRQHFVAQAFWI